ncbi:hypothetical protein K474DRAFT_175830 [Panus rudis PR-1116 ss-1]|nr:hypothetical protein K474DRAFT_175830 [Panus rudis PR-1116 ss-1]
MKLLYKRQTSSAEVVVLVRLQPDCSKDSPFPSLSNTGVVYLYNALPVCHSFHIDSPRIQTILVAINACHFSIGASHTFKFDNIVRHVAEEVDSLITSTEYRLRRTRWRPEWANLISATFINLKSANNLNTKLEQLWRRPRFTLHVSFRWGLVDDLELFLNCLNVTAKLHIEDLCEYKESRCGGTEVITKLGETSSQLFDNVIITVC